MEHCIPDKRTGKTVGWDGVAGWILKICGEGGRECEYVSLHMWMGMWHGKGGNCLLE